MSVLSRLQCPYHGWTFDGRGELQIENAACAETKQGQIWPGWDISGRHALSQIWSWRTPYNIIQLYNPTFDILWLHSTLCCRQMYEDPSSWFGEGSSRVSTGMFVDSAYRGEDWLHLLAEDQSWISKSRRWLNFRNDPSPQQIPHIYWDNRVGQHHHYLWNTCQSSLFICLQEWASLPLGSSSLWWFNATRPADTWWVGARGPNATGGVNGID